MGVIGSYATCKLARLKTSVGRLTHFLGEFFDSDYRLGVGGVGTTLTQQKIREA